LQSLRFSGKNRASFPDKPSPPGLHTTVESQVLKSATPGAPSVCGAYIGGFDRSGYNKCMEISFAPELEARLNRIASGTGKGPDEVVRELVASYLDHDEWFRQEVAKGLASLDRGKFVSHDDVRRQMECILGSQ
jgi:predicted transcriptional regulator